MSGSDLTAVRRTAVVIIFSLLSCGARADLNGARLTQFGQEHYSQPFTLGGYVDLDANAWSRSLPHTLNPGTFIQAGFDLTWSGLRLGQNIARLEEGLRYLARLEYNYAWSAADIQLAVVTVNHIENQLKNHLEYTGAVGFRWDDNRLALQAAWIDDQKPHFALELLHEWNIHRMFYWQNLFGVEQVARPSAPMTIAQDARSTVQSGSKAWFPYLQTVLVVDLTEGESWNPAFELGFYLYRDRYNNVAFRFTWGLQINFS